MIFPTESIIQLRRDLLKQMEAGTLTHEQMFLRALELDPFDATSLAGLGDARFEAGNLTGAAEYFWRAAAADACRYDAWFKLNTCLPAGDPLHDGITELGTLKALRDPEGPKQFEKLAKAKGVTDFEDGEALLASAADGLFLKRDSEPIEVALRLQPYRLIDDLLENAIEGLEDDLVDEILEDGARCLPLLLAVLRGMPNDSLPDGHPAPVVCSLALIGQIGDPASVPDLIDCCISVEDEEVTGAALWALKRIAAQHPDVVIDAVRELTPGAGGDARGMLSLVLTGVPEHPARHAALLGLLDGFANFSKDDRILVFAAVAMGLNLLEGAKGRELVWSLMSRYTSLLPKQARKDLQEAFKLHEGMAEMISRARESEGEETVYDLCNQDWSEDEEEDDSDEEEEDEFNEHEEEFDGLEFEEEEDFVPGPVRRVSNRGRNDPCWCGSGKKYKKCHLESDEKAQAAPVRSIEEGRARGGTPEVTELRRLLLDFTAQNIRKREMEEAMITFLGSEPPSAAEKEGLSGAVLDWLAHDYVVPRLGHPMIEEFLKHSPGGLSLRQRKILEGWSRSRFSIFEVQEVRKEAGVQVKDLLAGGEVFVNDVSTSQWAARRDAILARLEEFDGRHNFTAIVLHIPRDVVAPLIEWANSAKRRSGLDWARFLRVNSHKLRRELWRLANAAEPPVVVSPEGDEVEFSSARYAILDEKAVRSALDRSKAFTRDAYPDSYGWLDEVEHAPGERRAYGSVKIDGGKLTLACISRERLERGKELLADLAGAHLRHLGDDFRTVEDATLDSGKAPEVPRELELEIVRQALAQHYQKWLDMRLPALDGKTPREAARTPQGRPKLINLLKLLENGEEHKRREEDAWYDVTELKRELGVDY